MIHIITGPPCAGKTTHAHQHDPGEAIVIDLDALAHALGYPTPHLDWDTTHPAKTAAIVARASLIKRALAGKWQADVVIIDSAPRDLDRYTLGAHITVLDPGRDVCHQRADADGRSDDTHTQIDLWYDTHAPSRGW